LEPPDLQALVERFGGYNRIPDWGWAEYDAELAEAKARLRELHQATGNGLTWRQRGLVY
jgi:hypothetical protein